MRHKVAGFKLKRDTGARDSLLRNLTTSVILQERIITTVPKAKAVRPLVEKMITLAKRDTLHTRRQAAAVLRTPASVKKLFDTLGTRFGQRAGGYTRITRLGPRKGDGAEQAMIELVGSELVKRAADRAKRREERLKARQEGREPEEEETRSKGPGANMPGPGAEASTGLACSTTSAPLELNPLRQRQPRATS